MQPLTFLAGVVLLICLCNEGYSASCLSSFKNSGDIQKVGENCVKAVMSQGVSFETIASMQDLEKIHFEDKCIANCTLTKLNFMKNGTLQKDTIIAVVKKNTPKDVQDKLIVVLNDCAELVYGKKHHNNGKEDKAHKKEKTPLSTTQRSLKSSVSPKLAKNLASSNQTKTSFVCKQAAKFLNCFKQKEEKMC